MGCTQNIHENHKLSLPFNEKVEIADANVT